MPKRDQDTGRIVLIQGTLDLLILQTLQWGPQHGHGIGQAIRINSEDALQIEHGSLYPALHRLERRGWLSSEWKMSEANRRAKYYKITAQGKKQLIEEQSRWKQLVRTVARTMKPVEE
ncbi:MAG TPA: PadR family transcriptional regulator [Bryobacteraceae bacterium]|nr:PadR family transcriptional regulator [Bryobacteraceae bacterium]